MFIDPQLEVGASAEHAPRELLPALTAESGASPPPRIPQAVAPSPSDEAPLPASVSGLSGLSFSELLDRAVANDSSSLPPPRAAEAVSELLRDGRGGVTAQPEEPHDTVSVKKPFLRRGSRVGPFAARSSARRSPAIAAAAEGDAAERSAPRSAARGASPTRSGGRDRRSGGSAGNGGSGSRASGSRGVRAAQLDDTRSSSAAAAAMTSPAWEGRWDVNADERGSPGPALWEHRPAPARAGREAADISFDFGEGTAEFATEVAHFERAQAAELDEFEKLERAAAEELRAQARAEATPQATSSPPCSPERSAPLGTSLTTAEVHVNRHGSIDIRPPTLAAVAPTSPLRRSFAGALGGDDSGAPRSPARSASGAASPGRPTEQVVFVDDFSAGDGGTGGTAEAPRRGVGASDDSAFNVLAEISASFGDGGDDAMPWDADDAADVALPQLQRAALGQRGGVEFGGATTFGTEPPLGATEEAARTSRSSERSAAGGGGGGAADEVYQKIADLEEQISGIKVERRALKTKTALLERRENSLAGERDDFERWRLEQQGEVEAWIVEQQRSIQKQKKAAMRQAKARSASANAVDRKDRAEIDALKAKIATMQVEDRKRVERSRALAKRQQQKIAECVSSISELENDLRFAEERASAAEDDASELRERLEQLETRQRPSTQPQLRESERARASPAQLRDGSSSAPTARAGYGAPSRSEQQQVRVNRHGSIDVRPMAAQNHRGGARGRGSSGVSDDEVDELLMAGVGGRSAPSSWPGEIDRRDRLSPAAADRLRASTPDDAANDGDGNDDVVKHVRRDSAHHSLLDACADPSASSPSSSSSLAKLPQARGGISGGDLQDVLDNAYNRSDS